MEILSNNYNGDDAEALAVVREMPPLSSYLSKVLFWCKSASAPALLFGVNYAAFTTLVSFNQHGRRHYEDNGDDWRLHNFRTNSLYVALILLVDAVLLCHAASFLERDINEWRRKGGQGSDGAEAKGASSNHIPARVSHKMDGFFRHRPAPGGRRFVPVLVSLLYLLAALCGLGGLVAAALRAYGSTAHFWENCLLGDQGRFRDGWDEDVPGLPSGLQDWAKRRDYDDRSEVNFAHLKDGRTFSTVRRRIPDNGASQYDTENYLAVIDPKNSSAPLIHSDITDPYHFQSLGDAKEEGSDAFCCTTHLSRDPHRQASVHCAVAGEEGIFDSTLPSLQEAQRKRGSQGYRDWHETGEDSSISFNGVYWYRANWVLYECSPSGHGCHSHEFAQVFKVTPLGARVESIANMTVPHHGERLFDAFGRPEGGACQLYQNWIAGSFAVHGVVPISVYLFKIKELPAGMVPFVMATSFVLYTISEEFAMGLVALSILATSGLLISNVPSWTRRESIIWIHYSLIFLYVALDGFNPSFVLLLGIIVGIILYHPTLQLVGCLLHPVALLGGLLMLFTDGDLKDLFLISVFIVLGCAMVTAGETLCRYRAYFTVYARRIWAVIRGILQERATAVSEPAGQEDVARSLLG